MTLETFYDIENIFGCSGNFLILETFSVAQKVKLHDKPIGDTWRHCLSGQLSDTVCWKDEKKF